MPRGVKKENLPSKDCVACGRPFTWRKKWERCWDEVTTCSKSCNRKRRAGNRKAGVESSASGDDTPGGIGGMNTKELASSPKNAFGIEEFSRRRSTDDIVMSEMEGDERQPLSDQICSDDAVENGPVDPVLDAKARRKAEKKRKKAERRAQREGRGDPSAGQKQCTICGKSVDLLIRCQIDESQTWHMSCGKCWNDVSGGVVDGDDSHPHYRYGGLWKNRRAQTA